MYYQVYCILLNTLFATVLPLSSLLYLNVRTVKELAEMMRQQDGGGDGGSSDGSARVESPTENGKKKRKKHFKRT